MKGNQTALPEQPPELRNAMASGWMKRGIALLNENTEESLTASLQWFDGAIELRRSLPLQERPWYRYVLAAGWMNRGDALTRLGSTENLAEAVRSYDQALVPLRTLDLESNPLFRQRLALAWTNRGLTLQVQGTPASLRAALESFDEAIAVLRASSDPEKQEICSLLASALTNRANTLLRLSPPNTALARESAEQALSLVAGTEAEAILAAETGLKARSIFCQAIANQLEDRTTVPGDLVASATDTVDGGMKLARLWEARGEERFHDLAGELFWFGARVYQMHQPHFLSEFILENLDPLQSSDAFPVDREMHAAAGEVIGRALAELQGDGFRSLNTPRFDRFVEALRQLRVTQARLDELRRVAAFA